MSVEEEKVDEIFYEDIHYDGEDNDLIRTRREDYEIIL